MNYASPYWKPEHIDAVNEAQSFEDIGRVALSVVKTMPQPVGQVCGPISTGGQGSLEKNLEAFEKTIRKLVAEGKTIFDQVPYEEPIQKFKTDDPYRLLNGIYLPLFESGLIKEVLFMHDWQSSQGANWEHKQAERLGIKITYLPEDFLDV